MKCTGLLLLALLSVAVVRTEAGQRRTVCILIPVYDPEEFEEGENEEEEVRGWGPGPSIIKNGGSPASQSHHLPIVTHTQGAANTGGGGEGGPPPSPGTPHNPPGKGGISWGSMTDPSKPPGPNPKGGYWEWDSESRRWELEDFRRRKRRQSPGSVLSGKLQCGQGTVIHVDKVTLGFSIDNRCRPVRSGCQVTSTVGRQVSHCEGRTGACSVTVMQKYLQHCGRRTNYAKIQYECISESEQQNICEAKAFQTTGSLVLSSPSFSGSAGPVNSGAQAQYLSCECEVARDDNEALAVPWLRTRMEQGKEGACGEELLLVDTWDDSTNRFRLREEMCGVRSVRDKVWTSSVVKLTYIPSSVPKTSTGFLLRIQGNPNPGAHLQVTCSVVPAGGGPSPPAGPPPAPPSPPSPGTSDPSAATSPDKKMPPKMPPNFNLKNYPGLLNKTLAAWRKRLNQQQQQEGSAASQIGGQDTSLSGRGSASAVVHPGSEPPHEEFDVKGTSGTLSAVVASLSSIILIMGSLGAYLWYRRSQKKKKKKQEMIYYDSRSTVRSNATLYSEPIYQDPTHPTSGIPTSLPIGSATEASHPAIQNLKVPESLQKISNGKAGGGRQQPPAPPMRPPRHKKDKVRRLPSEEDVAYDNNAGIVDDVKVILDEDYASLDDISDALASQDGSLVQTEA